MKYELRLECRGMNKDFTVQSFDTILADDLVSLISQLMILVATLHRREMEEQNAGPGKWDDDIPF